MRTKCELAKRIKGYVTGYWLNIRTGQKVKCFERGNVITYTAADIMARLLGGDTAYLPGHMGFVYGEINNPGAALIEPPVSRVQTYASISTELADAGVGGNVLISPLSVSPGYSLDTGADSSLYAANAVTLTAHSGSRLEYMFASAAPYADELVTGDYFWHVLLLTRLQSGSTITYLPFARVTVKDGTYPQKLDNFELAIYWQISYF